MAFENENSEQKLERRHTAFPTVLGALMIILSLSVYAFYLKPVKEEVALIKAEVVESDQGIAELQEKLDEYSALENDLGLSSDVDKFRILNKIPVGMNQDDVIRDLIKLTEDNDIKLKSLGFGRGSESGIGALKVNASFEGNYSDLIAFLRAIETSKRLFKVNSINVQFGDDVLGGNKRATFSLAMEAFYQEESN